MKPDKPVKMEEGKSVERVKLICTDKKGGGNYKGIRDMQRRTK